MIFLGQVVGGLKSSIGYLLEKRTQLTRSATNRATPDKRTKATIERLLFILERWGGKADIYHKSWRGGPDIVIFCDVAIAPEPTPVGSFGKGAFTLPSKRWFAEAWKKEELSIDERKETLFNSARAHQHC